MRVVISAPAKSSLREIARFIGRRDKVRARSFVRELQATAHALGTKPLAFAVVPRFAAAGVRKRLYRGYIIFIA